MKFNLLHKICILLGMVLLGACATQQDNGPNRRLHNLSARYNYIYNANLLLAAYEHQLAQQVSSNLDQITPIYPEVIIYTNQADTASQISLDPSLAAIAQKAYAVIQEKNLSNYLDEAYMLLGKVHYYAAQYYMAAEYFDYVERAYPDNHKVLLEALTWKARTYMQMGESKMAESLLNKSMDLMKTWKRGGTSLKAETYATLAQFSINQNQYTEAYTHLTQAQKLAKHQLSRTRWNFVAAQIQEQQKNAKASTELYQKVIRGNASYELYFQAQLGKIRTSEHINPTQNNTAKALERLLTDDKNKEVQDRIYAELGQQALLQRQYEIAQSYFQKGLTVNLDQSLQKGSLYLKLADLNFKQRNQYVDAKLYYDSALIHLPSYYPGYELLKVKTENLNYLSSRYQKINLYDSLLRYSQLSASNLDAALNRKFLVEFTKQELAEKQAAENAAKLASLVSTAGSTRSAGSTNSVGSTNTANQTLANAPATFYFNNPVAIQKGRNDFQKKWGKRKLEPNWRQINKTFSLANSLQTAQAEETIPDDTQIQKQAWIDEKVNQFKNQIPQSETDQNHAIASIQKAMLEIGRFYQQDLNDPKEAILIFENYLQKYPESSETATLYYSLYLAYQALNQTQADAKFVSQAEHYKNKVLTQFSNSDYAKVILDPQYYNKQQALNQVLQNAYNQTFQDYQENNYKAVIESAQNIEQRFPANNMQIQFDYLKAISIGKTSKLPALMEAFNTIKQKYQQDSLITPLIKKHEAYITQHIDLYATRDTALMAIDPTEINPIATPKTTRNTIAAKPSTANPNVVAGTHSQAVTSTTTTNPAYQIPTNQTPANQTPAEPEVPKIKTDGLFTDQIDPLYYYVVSVESMQHSLSSSRFGIGQFNRGLYGGENLKHQLFDLDEHQVIFVGDFDNLEDIKAYSEVISAQLGRIMKVPSNLYQGFYISKTNFEHLKSSQNLKRYLKFYKENLEK